MHDIDTRRPARAPEREFTPMNPPTAPPVEVGRVARFVRWLLGRPTPPPRTPRLLFTPLSS